MKPLTFRDKNEILEFIDTHNLSLNQGSVAAEVVQHALDRFRKGKRPSRPYRGCSEPIQALGLAILDLLASDPIYQSRLGDMRYALDALRNASLSPEYRMDQIRLLRHFLADYERMAPSDLGITSDDLADFEDELRIQLLPLPHILRQLPDYSFLPL